MKIEVRFFASLREALGSAEAVEMPEGSTLGELRDHLLARGGRYQVALGRKRAVRCALNHVLLDESTVIQAVDGAVAEVAFFPPVTGG
jgi:molybdopterin synthase sulfur carrier subunit